MDGCSCPLRSLVVKRGNKIRQWLVGAKEMGFFFCTMRELNMFDCNSKDLV